MGSKSSKRGKKDARIGARIGFGRRGIPCDDECMFEFIGFKYTASLDMGDGTVAKGKMCVHNKMLSFIPYSGRNAFSITCSAYATVVAWTHWNAIKMAFLHQQRLRSKNVFAEVYFDSDETLQRANDCLQRMLAKRRVM